VSNQGKHIIENHRSNNIYRNHTCIFPFLFCCLGGCPAHRNPHSYGNRVSSSRQTPPKYGRVESFKLPLCKFYLWMLGLVTTTRMLRMMQCSWIFHDLRSFFIWRHFSILRARRRPAAAGRRRRPRPAGRPAAGWRPASGMGPMGHMGPMGPMGPNGP